MENKNNNEESSSSKKSLFIKPYIDDSSNKIIKSNKNENDEKLLNFEEIFFIGKKRKKLTEEEKKEKIKKHISNYNKRNDKMLKLLEKINNKKTTHKNVNYMMRLLATDLADTKILINQKSLISNKKKEIYNRLKNLTYEENQYFWYILTDRRLKKANALILKNSNISKAKKILKLLEEKRIKFQNDINDKKIDSRNCNNKKDNKKKLNENNYNLNNSLSNVNDINDIEKDNNKEKELEKKEKDGKIKKEKDNKEKKGKEEKEDIIDNCWKLK